jgi:hypothetical protein
MSRKDRDRLKVLHEVRKRHITQVQAGKESVISPRWVRELLRRMKARGDRALVHGLRGLAVRQASHCKSLTYVGEHHSVRICFRVASLRKMHLDGLDFVRLDLNANHVTLYRKVSG